MKTSVSRSWIGFVDAIFPVARSKEAVEIGDLIGMADEAIDFLIHEVDEDLATSIRKNPLDQIEWSAGPPKGINEGERRNEPSVAHEFGIALFKCNLERDA